MCLKSDYTIDYKGKEDFKHSASNLKLLTKYPKSVDTLEGNTLTLPFPLPILLLFFWKKVKESVIPCMETSKQLDAMQLNTLFLSFFQNKIRFYNYQPQPKNFLGLK